MHLLWAVGCKTIEPAPPGHDVTGLGEDGFVLSDDAFPYTVVIPCLVCFEADAGDEFGMFYDFGIAITGPDGRQQLDVRRIAQRADTSPQLIDPERYYVPTPIEVAVTSAGEYYVVFFDLTAARYVLPLRFVTLLAP